MYVATFEQTLFWQYKFFITWLSLTGENPALHDRVLQVTPAVYNAKTWIYLKITYFAFLFLFYQPSKNLSGSTVE